MCRGLARSVPSCHSGSSHRRSYQTLAESLLQSAAAPLGGHERLKLRTWKVRIGVHDPALYQGCQRGTRLLGNEVAQVLAVHAIHAAWSQPDSSDWGGCFPFQSPADESEYEPDPQPHCAGSLTGPDMQDGRAACPKTQLGDQCQVHYNTPAQEM